MRVLFIPAIFKIFQTQQYSLFGTGGIYVSQIGSTSLSLFRWYMLQGVPDLMDNTFLNFNTREG